jgi:purine nucleosidase
MSRNKRIFLIDTDTASDDAVALIMALRNPEIRVAAITTVAGNVDVEQGTNNALYTVELCGADVRVYRGAEKPLTRPLEDASWYHGKDGLGDHGYKATRHPEKEHGVDAMIRTIQENPGLTLVTLGPLTNVALALQKQPSIANQIGRCVVMGGAPCCEGNVTPAAEYNFWVDPEAARIVLRTLPLVELIGWQLSRAEAALNFADIKFVTGLNTKYASFAIECNSTALAAHMLHTGEQGVALADPVAMAIAIDPTIALSWSEHYADIEVESVLTRGMSVVDRLNIARNIRNKEIWAAFENKKPNAKVCWTLDIKRWKELLYAALR